MSVQFFTEYPLWFTIFCLAMGALYAFILYRANHGVQFDKNSKLFTWLLSILRFASVSIIAFLLLNPLLKYISTSTEKPIVILAIDNSESMLNAPDSNVYNTALKGAFDKIQGQLGDDIKLEPYLFGDEAKIEKTPNFKDKESDFSEFFTIISNVYSGSNVGGMILFSDGIYNKGSNPAYAGSKLKFPVYTIGLGDTVTKKDLKISNVRTNSIAYLNNTFPAIIDIEANKCLGQTFKMTLLRGKEKVYEQNITPSTSKDFKSIQIDLEANKPGVLQYSVILSQLQDEVTWLNNRKDFFIEVLDARQKVLIAARSPHPDISALRQAIESNKNYQVVLDLTGNPNADKIDAYDIVVLHQLPATSAHVAFIETLKSKKIPLLFILGRQTNLGLFNNLNIGLTYNPTGGGFNQTTGIMNTEFNLFENSETVKSNIPNFPPLTVPFGTFTNRDKSQILVYQQIGSVSTQQPLICFSEDMNNRYGVFTGEGIWRWRLMDFDRNNNQDMSNELVCKSIQYLVARNDRRKFRAYPADNSFYENENILFNAEYYNQSYELVNKPEVKLTLTNEEGKNYTYTFSRTVNAYKLNAGNLAPGSYSFVAKAVSGANGETVSGKIRIKPLQLEFTETKANHEVLKQLSLQTNGQFAYLSGLDSLIQRIKSEDSIKPVMYEQKDFKDLINQKWVFFLILGLISIEWFIRKRNGSY